MNIAICVEPKSNSKTDYIIWYLKLNQFNEVYGIEVISKEDLIKDLFEHFSRTGKSNWRCFQKDQENSTPIEIFDFVSLNQFENTHFGNLPSLSEFQNVIDGLNLKFQFKRIA